MFDKKDLQTIEKLWFDLENDSAIEESRKRYIKMKEEKIKQGYILESNGVYYKEQDILDGKCPLNGTLYHMGYRHNSDGTWRKA